MADSFSRRFDLRPVPAKLVRNEAPRKMREALLVLLSKHGVPVNIVRDSFYHVVQKFMPSYLVNRPRYEHLNLRIDDAEWYEFYDFVETLCSNLKDYSLEEEITALFAQHGIGWKILYGQMETRGDEPFEKSVFGARDALKCAGSSTAASELEEAIADLSRRPNPDARGAIVRAVGAVEALAKDLKKDSKATLGQLIKQLGLPKPLDSAAAQLWGYASDQARHVTEGQEPDRLEAAFVVQVCAAFISYLSKNN